MRIEVLWPRSGGPEIQLHPRITVILGLLPVERVELISTAHSLAVGDEPAWDGIADVHGVEVALDEMAEEFGRTADAALILTAEEIAEISESSVETVSPPVAMDVDADSLASLRARRDDIAEQLAGAERLTSEMHGRIASARANIHPEVFKSLDSADDALRRAAEGAGRPDPWTGMSGVPGRIVHLDAVVASIDAKMDKLPSGDRVILAGASAAAKVALSDGDLPLPQAARLLEKLSVLELQRKDVEAKFRALGFDADGARARLESAEAAMHTAEHDAIARPVSAPVAVAIERTHEEVLAESRKVAGGLRRGSARKRLDEVQKELHSLLESIGYTTWSQYRMGNGEVPVAAESVRKYELSIVELEAAKSEWEAVSTSMGADPVLKTVVDALAATSAEAQRLLGYDTKVSLSIGRLLRELADAKVDASSSTLVSSEVIADLRRALDDCGSLVHGEIASAHAVDALGESWLAVLRDADVARTQLVHDRRRCVCELEALRALGEASRVDRLNDQRQDVSDAEAESRDSIDAMCVLVGARIELYVLTATRLSLAEEHDEAVDTITQADHSMRLMTGQDQRQFGALDDLVVRGVAGPLPVVVVASGDDVPDLDALLDLADDVQIVVIADAESTIGWAEAQGDQRVGIVRRGVVA